MSYRFLGETIVVRRSTASGGTGDDIQAALDAAVTGIAGGRNTPRRVLIPSGTWTIADTLTAEDGVDIVGDGGMAKLVWTGTGAIPILRLRDYSPSGTVGGLRFIANLWFQHNSPSDPPSQAIALDAVETPLTSHSQVHFDNIWIGRGDTSLSAGNPHYSEGIATTGHDVGNDFHWFTRCYFRGCGIGTRQKGGNASSWKFDSCVWFSNDVAVRSAANLDLFDCFLSNSFEADFDFVAADWANRRTLTMVNVRGEQSQCWIRGDASVAVYGIGCSFKADKSSQQNLVELTGNLAQRVELRSFELQKGSTPTAITAVVKPAVAGQADKTFDCQYAGNLDLEFDTAQTNVGDADRRHLRVNRISQSGGTSQRVDVLLARNESLGDYDGVTDTPAAIVRMGNRRADTCGATEVRTLAVSHTFSGVGDGSGGYTVPAAIPAGALVLGVTVRRALATPLSPGTSSVDIGTASDPDKWGTAVLLASGGGGDNNRTASEDYTDGSPLWVAADTDIVVTKREGGTPGGTLNGVTFKFTIHYLRCVGAPE